MFSFANPVLTYRCYANVFNIEPSNTNKYITGSLNKGQLLVGVKGVIRVESKEGNIKVKKGVLMVGQRGWLTVQSGKKGKDPGWVKSRVQLGKIGKG